MRQSLKLAAAAVFALAAACGAGGGGHGSCRLPFYGTYSLGTKYASSFRERAAELRDLGGNFVVALGASQRELDELPPGMLAAPGCSLIKPSEWNNDATARQRLQGLAAQFGSHPRVWGICLSHEVDEFADHDRRVRMYRLAKPFFPDKRVFFYYAKIPGDYGLRGEVEGDVLFSALNPFNDNGDFDRAKLVEKLGQGLGLIDRTPGIPLWAQTSVNADHGYVTGPETMTRTWGPNGENMLIEAEEIFARTSPAGTRLTGLFWRSFGRFNWDLGYPAFTAHRSRMREISRLAGCS